MSREEKQALIQTLKIYAETDKPITQEFYQALCYKAIELLKSEPEQKNPLEYPWQIHINEKTKEEYYVKLRTLIPDDLFERTKKSEPEAGEFTDEHIIEWLRSDAIPRALQDGCNRAAGIIDRLQAENEILREYAQHLPGCPRIYGDEYSCNCRYEQALKESHE